MCFLRRFALFLVSLVMGSGSNLYEVQPVIIYFQDLMKYNTQAFLHCKFEEKMKKNTHINKYD